MKPEKHGAAQPAARCGRAVGLRPAPKPRDFTPLNPLYSCTTAKQRNLFSRPSEMFCGGTFQKCKRHGSRAAIHQTPRTKLSNLIRALSLSLPLAYNLEVEHKLPSSIAFFLRVSVFSFIYPIFSWNNVKYR
jgi:hypothetical protein